MPRIITIKKVNKAGGMNYIKPALRELLKLSVGYEVKRDTVIIKIPKFIPIEK